MLLGILVLYEEVGTSDFRLISLSNFSFLNQKFLWVLFFLGFAVKVPMLPVHIWLPEAHVEAPTAGSVLLAGLLLKLGTYGMLRLLIPCFSLGSFYFLPLVFTFCLLGILYTSCVTIRQIDLKKIIAYSSVVHMNFCLLGLFSNNLVGLSGSIFLMLSHGIVSGGLFLVIGLLYERYHSRLIKYYGGLVQFMPLFSIFFILFTLAI